MNTIILNDNNTLLSITPSKIVCVGRNYVEHIRELNNEIPENIVFFLKPNSAISTTLQSFHQEPLHYEAELCFLYQNGAFSAIGLGLDLTKRTLQSKLKSKGLPWERAKAFNGAAVFSNFVPMTDNNQDWSFELTINNQLVQMGYVDLMIYKPEIILDEIKAFMDLNDGDIIMTGTPKGVGVINEGDVFSGYVKNSDGVLISAEWVAQ